jgi:hypothetical protein
MKDKINGIKVISEYLNIAINIATKAIIIDGIAAISGHILAASDVNIE